MLVVFKSFASRLRTVPIYGPTALYVLGVTGLPCLDSLLPYDYSYLYPLAMPWQDMASPSQCDDARIHTTHRTHYSAWNDASLSEHIFIHRNKQENKQTFTTSTQTRLRSLSNTIVNKKTQHRHSESTSHIHIFPAPHKNARQRIIPYTPSPFSPPHRLTVPTFPYTVLSTVPGSTTSPHLPSPSIRKTLPCQFAPILNN